MESHLWKIDSGHGAIQQSDKVQLELEEGEEFIEIESDDNIEISDLKTIDTLNGEPFAIKDQPVKLSFDMTHTRITTYLENNIHQIVRILLKQGQIDSITKFINDSIQDNLLKNYNGN